MKTKTANRSENIFIKEWNGTEFNLSIPAKITNSNKPFIYFYWPNKLKGGNLDRARKGGVGGVNDSRLKIKKNAPFAVDALTQLLGKGWDPFTNEFIQVGISVDLNSLSPIVKCCDHWLKHRQERFENQMIGKTAIKNNHIVIAHLKDWLEKHNYLSRKIGSFTSIDIDNFFGFKAKQRKWGVLQRIRNCTNLRLQQQHRRQFNEGQRFQPGMKLTQQLFTKLVVHRLIFR